MLLNLRNITCGSKGANYRPIETTSSLPLQLFNFFATADKCR